MRKLNVGFIGCGGFGRAVHITNMKANPKYHLRAAMDINEAAAKTTAEEFGMQYWTTDLNRLLSDDSIDVAVISTVHDSHAELSVAAANAGKHVLCEKPMGLNREECKAVAEAVKKNGVKYTVGYNRGMAPLVTQARDMIANIPHKKLIYHCIQALFPVDHWTHDPARGGGRFVGEGCHIFDLICELIQCPPVSVYASGGTFLDPNIVKIPDSGIVTITFADGSVGTTLIASAGCGFFPKESTEIYVDLKAIHINDFKEMTCCGFDGKECEKIDLGAIDKGHKVEIDLFADAILNDTDPPNGPINAAKAAVISFMVSESIATGQAVPITEKDYVF
ncbi:MAG: Gfo/Idh/MocA family oxidoreductase [Armatimonadota bacterium]|nr:Gfo/Idh/MocA family oxidoreductase [Armatimonadota bacterium]